MNYLHEPQWTDGNANMTCEEYYRLYGTLTKERIEYLLENRAKSPEDITPYISEAMGCYMPEDFLYDEIYRLQQVRDRVRGGNKEELASIIEAIESVIYEQAGQSEYGISELKSALNELGD